jgi:hypothetical protein
MPTYGRWLALRDDTIRRVLASEGQLRKKLPYVQKGPLLHLKKVRRTQCTYF